MIRKVGLIEDRHRQKKIQVNADIVKSDFLLNKCLNYAQSGESI